MFSSVICLLYHISIARVFFNRTLTNLPVFPLHCKVKSFLGWQFLSSPLPLFLLLLLPMFPSITKKKDNQFVLLFVFNYFVSFLRLNPKPAKPSIVTKLPATVNKTFCFSPVCGNSGTTLAFSTTNGSTGACGFWCWWYNHCFSGGVCGFLAYVSLPY